MDKPCS